ncbi:methyl-accepting chemotaxis protein [Vibrio parahaemolyticus]|uniref:methyl-accepting chemotaxis protein n=1 Tax=Vibrio fluvialis TaxID=676 RepID=UPI0015594B65|nr:methyl-accepting chemotaxis protein [Vibrio fluvialis]EJE4163875.1 methyl-accepting chemotaxis protein [Vibrio parahaemolyticus]EJR0962161.1 methyl-accepting chemotaxis protein [Vibrio parahaemolyticus]QKE35835.1 methyl-accepting chemotaxis protein [Vibrio fluvialis]
MKRLSFKTTIFTVILSLLLASIAVSFMSSRYFIQDEFVESDTRAVETQISLISQQLENQFSSYIQLADSIPVNLSNVAQVLESSGFHRITKVMYGSVFSPDPSIPFVENNPPTFLELDATQEARYRQIAKFAETGNYIGSIEHVDGLPIIAIAHPSIDTSGGIDIFEINLQPSLDNLSMLNHEGSFIELIDNNGQMLFTNKDSSNTHSITLPIQFDQQQWQVIGHVDSDYIDAHTSALNQKILLTTLFAAVLLVAIGMTIIHFAYKPIVELRTLVGELANGEGDLTQQLIVKSDDDLGNIAKSINDFIQQLNIMLREVQGLSTLSTTEINQLHTQTLSNKEMAQKHNAEMERAATAVTEMSATAEQVSQSAFHSAQLTQQAISHAQKSDNVVSTAVASVDALNQEFEAMSNSISSMVTDVEQIHSVLSVIGGIAEQTNLLALNAAIEAARAGEQGRSFAVVADEVRALAARTQDSTSQINEMLNSLHTSSETVVSSLRDTQQRCSETSASTTQITQSLNEVINAIKAIDATSAQIAQAAAEQTKVSSEIDSNMTSMNQMVQVLDTNSQQATVSMEQLAATNQSLENIVKRFKLH